MGGDGVSVWFRADGNTKEDRKNKQVETKGHDPASRK